MLQFSYEHGRKSFFIHKKIPQPLSVAGRVIVRKNEKGSSSLRQILVNIDRDLVMIPNLAIHMNREANEGRKIDVQNEIRPVLSLGENKKLLSLVAEEACLSESDIISHDLFLYNRSQPSLWGAENEFISAPKLDDLECACSTLQGFIAAAKNNSSCDTDFSEQPLPVYCVFDNEEVGSSSRQGADSTFLSDTLSRIAEKLDWSPEEYKIALSQSLMLSADNAHALHPNYISYSWQYQSESCFDSLRGYRACPMGNAFTL